MRDLLGDKVTHETPRSACVNCPYHTDYEWHRQKTTDPQAWKRATEIDNALRTTGCRANRDMKQTMYLHRSCKPLELVQLDPTPPVPRAVQLPMNFAGEVRRRLRLVAVTGFASSSTHMKEVTRERLDS